MGPQIVIFQTQPFSTSMIRGEWVYCQPKQCTVQWNSLKIAIHLLLVQSHQNGSHGWYIQDLLRKNLGFQTRLKLGHSKIGALDVNGYISMATSHGKACKPLDIYSVCWAMIFLGLKFQVWGLNMLTYMDRHMIWMIIFDRNIQYMPGID